ncbi:MAG: hypothetical protein RL677_478 [Actinomycetota bacterium]|jgi:hypothetical protein
MNEKMRPEDKIVDGLMALGQIAMGLNEFIAEKVNEKLKPCSCGKKGTSADIRQIVQEEIRAFMGKHNFVTEEELAALRKVVNQIKSTKKTKPKG